MKESDKKRILNFLLGKVPLKDFESWIYTEAELEYRIGSDFYFDLIEIDYRNNDSIHIAINTILRKYIDPVELKNFKYREILEQAGWFQGRKVEQNIKGDELEYELKNAWDILTEFGGLELISNYKANYWTPKNIDFPKTVERTIHGAKYGLDKQLICFAHIDDNNSALYVDDENNYYQLDDIANIDLYRFKEKEFPMMLQNLLGLDKQNYFEHIGSLNRI